MHGGAVPSKLLADEHRPDDIALHELGRIVHGADFADEVDTTPESIGLRTISQGFPLVAGDDHELVEKAPPRHAQRTTTLHHEPPNRSRKVESVPRMFEYASRMGRTTTLVILEPDVAAVFGTSESVNSALRALVAIPVPKRRKKAS